MAAYTVRPEVTVTDLMFPLVSHGFSLAAYNGTGYNCTVTELRLKESHTGIIRGWTGSSAIGNCQNG